MWFLWRPSLFNLSDVPSRFNSGCAVWAEIDDGDAVSSDWEAQGVDVPAEVWRDHGQADVPRFLRPERCFEFV